MNTKKILLAMIAWLMTLGIQAQERSGHFFKSFEGEKVSVENVDQRFADWFSLPAETEWRQVSSSTDQLGMDRIEYRQYVAGVEVEHSQVLIHAKDGVVLTANGTVMETSKTPKKMYSSAAIYKSGTPTDELGRKVYLVYTPDGYRYATKSLSADFKRWNYIDIETNEIIKSISTTHFDTSAGTSSTAKGRSIYSGEVTLDVMKRNDGSTYLYDPTRNIHTMVGATLPTFEELFDSGKVFNYFPQGDLPNDLKEDDEQLVEEWLKYIAELAQKNKLENMEKLITDNASYVSNPDPVYSLNKIKTLTIKKLVTPSPKKTLHQNPPAEIDDEISLNLLFTYGDQPSHGMIEEMPFTITSLPQTIDLSDFIDVIPKQGLNIQITENRFDMSTYDTKVIPVTDVPVVLDASQNGRFTFSNDAIELEITYEECGDPTADIHWGMARTLDFYKDVFNRNSYDDKGSPVYNLVYVTNKEEDCFLLYQALCNASAASFKPYPMLYGLGSGNSTDDDPMRPIVELSVMAHEYTHIITDQNARLEYLGESGALNESFSDIMGIAVKKHVKGTSDWDLAEGVVVGKPNMRSMSHPETSGLGPCPYTYQGKHWIDTEDQEEENDYGGVHTNSGVQNKWFYLLTEGGTGKNDKGFSYDVTGIGIEKAQQIAYRNLMVYATSQAQYADIRKGSLQAAKDLYGAYGPEVKAVTDAWNAVGVYESGDVYTGIHQTAVDNSTPGDDTYYNLQGMKVEHPTTGIYIKNGKKVLVK